LWFSEHDRFLNFFARKLPTGAKKAALNPSDYMEKRQKHPFKLSDVPTRHLFCLTKSQTMN